MSLLDNPHHDKSFKIRTDFKKDWQHLPHVAVEPDTQGI